jgi:archaellum biogenesis ATPase FlaH
LDYEEVESFWIRNDYCIADELIEKGSTGKTFRQCGSSDAMGLYENEPQEGEVYYTGYCRSCNQSFSKVEVHGSSLAGDLGVSECGEVTERRKFERKPPAVAMTHEEVKDFIQEVGYESNNYRGIKDEYSRFFGHLTKLDKQGNVLARYYPETSEESGVWPTGYKCRNHPKDFRYGKVGVTGQKSKLSGQVKFEHMEFRDILIVGGEEGKAAFYQIWEEGRKAKGNDDFAPMPVVSGTTGEGSLLAQVRANFDFINRAENIYLGLDNDHAGIAAMEDICKILPKDKIRIVKWTKGDPNDYIHNKEGRDYSRMAISDFYNAKEYVDSGVFASNGLLPYIKEALQLERIPLPYYMSGVQGMTRGEGLIKNRIYNIIGMTSVGKSTHSNACVYSFAFLPKEKTAVVSLEATKGEYGVDILSLHLEKNLYWEEADAVAEYLDSPEVVEKANELFIDEDGESRFYVVDDRKGTVKSLEDLCERLFAKYGVTIIVIDVLTDILRVTSNEEQAAHLNWQSNFVKQGVTIFNVLHTRKLAPNADGIPKKATEYDAFGSSIFIQKAAGNIVVNRNKECPNEDYIERNTTYVDVPKMRQGDTGQATPWYYDPETRQCYDRDEFFKNNPSKLPEGYDLSISSFDKAYWEEGGRGYKGDGTESKSFTKKISKTKNSTPIVPNMNGGKEIF